MDFTLLYFIFGLWLCWAVIYLIFMRAMYSKNFKYLLEPRVNYMKTCEAGSRYDFIEFSKTQAYIGGLIIFPIRLSLAIPILLYILIVTALIKSIYGVNSENNQIPRGKWYMKLHGYASPPFLIRLLVFTLGVTKLKEKKFSIYDFLPDYEPQQDISIPALAVCNHVSPWLDLFYLGMKGISFVGKKDISTAFFLGTIAVARHSIFVNRNSKKDKNSVLKKIHDRIPKILDGSLPPILIFPEGTVTNGRVLMKFKRGAFSHTAPIKIFALRYNGKFINTFTNINPFASIIFSVGQFFSSLEVFEVAEPLCPLWVAKKHGISSDDPELWKYVAKEVKDIMSFMTGFRQVESGFKELDQFEQDEYYKYNEMKVSLCSRRCKIIPPVAKKTKFQIALEKKIL